MNATDLLFPAPRTVTNTSTAVRLPKTVALAGKTIPAWLRQHLVAALKDINTTLAANAKTRLTLELGALDLKGTFTDEQCEQSYRMEIGSDGAITIIAPSATGLQHGIITLCQLLRASATGAELTVCTITDTPVFTVRGLHVDLAREFFPRPAYLKKLINRMADLKLNTLWLYIENHFHAPNLPHISQKGGLTPEEARLISAYGAARGVDVVPGTNVLSHMEGILRLERYSDFVDGSQRSYPVLTEKRVWPLVKTYLDSLLDAFPSPNINPGLDELLFTGSHPEVIAAIEKTGKAAYFADFACKVIDYLQKQGKRVWIWDDMVLGKNVNRPVQGLGDDCLKALARIPKDVVMTHWYYWTNFNGAHSPMIERVARSGHPFVVAPNSFGFRSECGSLSGMLEQNQYLSSCGETHGAFGFICTSWQHTEGCSYEATWPLNALSAGFAWRGGKEINGIQLTAASLHISGESKGLINYLKAVDTAEKRISSCGVPAKMLRISLIQKGPQQVWRCFTSLISPIQRRAIRRLIDKAEKAWTGIGDKDKGLKQAMFLHITLLTTVIDILDRFDAAWGCYHKAALAEPEAEQHEVVHKNLAAAKAKLKAVATVTRVYEKALAALNRSTGHDPYDSYALRRWAECIDEVPNLIDEVVREKMGLPYFEKLLHLPDVYHNSNVTQLAVHNKFFNWHEGDNQYKLAPPPTRWC